MKISTENKKKWLFSFESIRETEGGGGDIMTDNGSIHLQVLSGSLKEKLSFYYTQKFRIGSSQ